MSTHPDMFDRYMEAYRLDTTNALQIKLDKAIDILKSINECPFIIDEATIPKSHIEDYDSPQIVANMSIAWLKIKSIRDFLAEQEE
jgi:hypothetical protein